MPKDLKTRGSVGFKNTSGDKECQLPLVSRSSSQTALPSAKCQVVGISEFPVLVKEGL